MFCCYIHWWAGWRKHIKNSRLIVFMNYLIFNLFEDARNGRDDYKTKFFENMKKYNCALLYGRSSRYVYDNYYSDFKKYGITAIKQDKEYYWTSIWFNKIPGLRTIFYCFKIKIMLFLWSFEFSRGIISFAQIITNRIKNIQLPFVLSVSSYVFKKWSHEKSSYRLWNHVFEVFMFIWLVTYQTNAHTQ